MSFFQGASILCCYCMLGTSTIPNTEIRCSTVNEWLKESLGKPIFRRFFCWLLLTLLLFLLTPNLCQTRQNAYRKQWYQHQPRVCLGTVLPHGPTDTKCGLKQHLRISGQTEISWSTTEASTGRHFSGVMLFNLAHLSSRWISITNPAFSGSAIFQIYQTGTLGSYLLFHGAVRDKVCSRAFLLHFLAVSQPVTWLKWGEETLLLRTVVRIQ